MTTRLTAVAIAAVLYAATGLYVVGGDEQAAVRRFGRAVRSPDGNVVLRGSGLHLDLPWPFSQVDRVRLNEVRTLSLGVPKAGNAALGGGDGRDLVQLLTGDRNLLMVNVEVQYRVASDRLDDWLFATKAPEDRLRDLVESAIVEAVAASGVDFVHTFGRPELQELLTARTRRLADEHRLGVDIELVAIEDVQPPSRVKAAFLDVSDARADREMYINSARTAQQQREQSARSEARELVDRAEAERRRRIEEARGAADSFTKLVDRMQSEAESRGLAYAEVRQLTLRRRYFDTMQHLLSAMAGKVFLDSGKPVDLTILRNAED